MRSRCLCHCHETPDEPWRADGVDVIDPVAAAAACPNCINWHTPALSVSRVTLGLAEPRGPRIRPLTPAERIAAWLELERELERRRNNP